MTYLSWFSRSCFLPGLFLVSFIGISFGEEDLAALLSRCRENLSKIKMIKATSTIKWEHKFPTFELKNRENTYVIRTDGRRFRDEFHFERATPNPNPDRIRVFNGRQLLQFDKPLNSFVKKTVEALPVPSPVTLETCFSWVFDGGEVPSWDGLQSDRVWSNVLPRARYVEQREEDGRKYDVIEIKSKHVDGASVKCEVSLAANMKAFPWRVKYHVDDKLVATCTVTRHKVIKAGADELVIPLEVVSKITEASRGDPGQRTYTLDERSLRINEEIDADAFELEPMGAEIRDLDKE